MEKAILDALPAMLNGTTDIPEGLAALNETLKPILAQERAEWSVWSGHCNRSRDDRQ